MNAPPLAVRAAQLRKRFGDQQALDGLDLQVPVGTVLGLLGRNGAGKTTAVRILTTLLRADDGVAEVAGFDVRRQSADVRRSIGVVGQSAAVDELLGGRQNLELFGRLFHLSPAAARDRATELLERFELADTGSKPVSTYSGGMRRRLDLAASLILAPPILFLDEPTTGLDPRGRTEVWGAIRGLVAEGATVLLTTQYLEEADQLADRIALMDAGRVIAEGSPDELKSRLGGDRLDVVVADVRELGEAAAVLAAVTGTEPERDPDRRRLSVPVADRVGALSGTLHALADSGISPEDVALRRPTLDDVFLHLTATEVAA